MPNPFPRWLCLQIPQSDYQPVLELQHRLVKLKKEGRLTPEIVILVEHPPVFTLGRRGERKHLRVSEAYLKAAGVPVIHVERGGDVTYHGPGQWVGYVIIHLKQAKLKVIELVDGLEEVMLRTADSWEVKAKRNPINRGIWVGSRKLGSVGIAVRRGISFHGFALNVSTSLKPFKWIHPCGLKGVSMTTLEREGRQKLSFTKIRDTLKTHLEAVFQMRLQDVTLADLGLTAYGGKARRFDNPHP
jgi:lipoate-protein ligase B